MSAFLAIVGDTWRQSKQQVVLIILIILMLLIAIGAAVIVKPMPSVALEKADGRLLVSHLEEMTKDLDGRGAIDVSRGMFGGGRSSTKAPRNQNLVITFDSLDQAEAAVESLKKNERLRGFPAIEVEESNLVFEFHTFAEAAAEVLEEEAVNRDDPGFERDFRFVSETNFNGPRKQTWEGEPRLKFASPDAADAALQTVLDSNFHSERKRFAVKAEPRFGFIWSDTPDNFLYGLWEMTFAQGVGLRETGKVEMDQDDLEERFKNSRKEREALLKDKTHLEISTEVFLSQGVMWLVFTVTMLLFIAASASYFPGMLAAGAVDVVVSRPVSRLRIFLGRYFGGLVLYAAIVFGTAGLLWLAMGLRVGYWPTRVFLGASLLFFAGSVIYALLAFLGVLTRSTPLGIIIGLVYYFVIDSVLNGFYTIKALGAFEDYPTVESIADGMRTIFPNFGQLKETSQYAILTMPYIDWTPVYTGGIWLVASLALGYWVFRRKDY